MNQTDTSNPQDMHNAAPVAVFEAIDAAALPLISDKVDRLNRRARKLGLAPLKVESTPARTVKGVDHNGAEIKRRVTDVTVLGIMPRLSGWALAHTVEHTSAGNLIHSVPGTSVDAEPYRAAESTCDHCNTTRRRNETYVLSREDGTVKRVGSTCLADFLGSTSVAGIVLCAEALALRVTEDEIAEYYGGSTRIPMEPVEFLAYVIMVYNRDGWRPRSKSDELNPATADVAMTAFYSRFNPRVPTVRPSSEDYTAAESMRAEVLAMIDGKRSVSDYEHNLRVACQLANVDNRSAGIVASAVAYYYRGKVREAEHKAEQAAKAALPASYHVGKVKERIAVAGVVEAMIPIDGYYGVTYITKIKSPEGPLFVWFASSRPDFDPGDTVAGKGTVKKHDEYRDEAQTVVTRCKLAKVDAG